MKKQRPFAPCLKLFGEGVIEATNGAGNRGDSDQCFSDFADGCRVLVPLTNISGGLLLPQVHSGDSAQTPGCETLLRGIEALRDPQCVRSWSPGLMCRSRCDTLFVQECILPTLLRSAIPLSTCLSSQQAVRQLRTEFAAALSSPALIVSASPLQATIILPQHSEWHPLRLTVCQYLAFFDNIVQSLA